MSEYLPIMILLFGLIIIIAEIWLISKKPGWGLFTIRIIGLTLVITSALFLVTIKDLKGEYLTSLIGLLGSIAGYLLGKNEEPLTQNKTKNDN